MSNAYTLRPWSDVVEPHPDVASGDLAMGTYAANLAAVAAGEHRGASVYSDPAEFFGATYFTEAMRKLIADVFGALSAGAGDRVLQLRTPFGGGKTHTLLALYHLATDPDAALDVPELKDVPQPGVVRTAVLSGEYLDPQRGRTIKGRRVMTLWGELAYQLGGWEAYDELTDDGDEGSPPGGEFLGRLLDGAPALVLLDEVLIYVAKGRAIRRHDSDVAKQTMIFLQNLSEAVNQSENGALVYSLQASVGEAVQEEALLRSLEHIAARIDQRREPVTGDEVLRVVQRRLFDSLGSEEVRRDVAGAYASHYEDELTASAETDSDLREAKASAETLRRRIELAYPFHPELIDLMYHRWGSLPTYQRTRGALQFLATVAHALWHGEGRSAALIGPGDVDLGNDPTRGTFFEQVGEERQYRAVVEADFLAADAGTRRVDDRLARDAPALGRLRVGTRLATTILLMSFGAREGEERGALEREVLDAALIPELDGNVLRSALKELRGEALLYLHHTGRRYRFEPRPNLNKMIIAEQDKFEPEEVLDHLKRTLDRSLTGTASSQEVVLWAGEPAQVRDGVEHFQVAYLHPDWDESAIPASDFVTANQRRFKNGLALVLPSGPMFDRARGAARAALAVTQLISDRTRHNFSTEQIDELKERAKNAESELGVALRDSYDRVLLPTRVSGGVSSFDTIDLTTVLAGGRGLHDRVRDALQNHVFDRLTASKVKTIAKLSDREATFLDELVEQLYTFFEMPRVWSPSALRMATASGVESGVFGYCVSVTLNGQAQVDDPSLIQFRKALPPDEVDLGAGAALLSPSAAERLLPKVEGDGVEPPGPPLPAGDDGNGPPPPAGGDTEQSRVLLEIKATEDDLHTLNTALSGLRSLVRQGTMRIELTVDASTDGDPIDQVRFQNLVRQHLEEDPKVDFDERWT